VLQIREAQPRRAATDILGMNGNVSDLTVTILTNIRDEIVGLRGEIREVRDEVRATNERLDTLTDRFDGLTDRVDGLTDRVETGFAAVNDRLDNVIKIVGAHHGELESRVRRIEDHLGF
jgi:uncharacterized protein YlxW (UPF0749 family)